MTQAFDPMNMLQSDKLCGNPAVVFTLCALEVKSSQDRACRGFNGNINVSASTVSTVSK